MEIGNGGLALVRNARARFNLLYVSIFKVRSGGPVGVPTLSFPPFIGGKRCGGGGGVGRPLSIPRTLLTVYHHPRPL